MKGPYSQRVAYADLLRVVAMVAVIVLHLSGSQLGAVAVDSQNWAILNVFDSLGRWSVPAFVMLSGMFLLDPERPLPISKLLFHNILRILTALLTWGLIYGVAVQVLAQRTFTPSMVTQTLRNLLQGNSHYHLWFLYMILGLYLVTPLLRAFVRGAQRSDFHWFFLIAFLWTSLLPTLFRLWPDATALLQTWYKALNIHLVLGYVGFYLAGYYLRSFPLPRPVRLLLYGLGLVGAAVTIWATRWLSLRLGTTSEIFYSNFAPNVVAMSAAVMVLFCHMPGDREQEPRRQWLGQLSQLTFGIYLAHDLFLMLLRGLDITPCSFFPVLAVPLLTAVVFLCSFAVAWLISKVPFLGRWVI